MAWRRFSGSSNSKTSIWSIYLNKTMGKKGKWCFCRSVRGLLELRLFAAPILEILTFQIPGETALFFLRVTLDACKLKLEPVLQLCKSCSFSMSLLLFWPKKKLHIYLLKRIKLVNCHSSIWGFLQQLQLNCIFFFFFLLPFVGFYVETHCTRFFFSSLFSGRTLEMCLPSALQTALKGWRRRNKKRLTPLRGLSGVASNSCSKERGATTHAHAHSL